MATVIDAASSNVTPTPRQTSLLNASRFPAQDTIILGVDRMPGVWWLLPGAKEFGWQIQQATGFTGASVVPIGDPLVECSFLVKFFRTADWDAFRPLREKYLKKPVFNASTRQTKAIGIKHKELNALGVTVVVPKKSPFFTLVGKNMWVGQVDFLQYRPPVLAKEAPRNVYAPETGAQPSAADVVDQATRSQNATISGARG